MNDNDRADKNRSTNGTSRRFDLGGGASKLATRNQSVKNKIIAKRDFSQNDVMSQKSIKMAASNLEDSIGVIGASINRVSKIKNVTSSK